MLCPLVLATLVDMVLKGPRARGRFFAVRMTVAVAAVLALGLLSQIIALAVVFGYSARAFDLAVLVLVATTVRLSLATGHHRTVNEPMSVLDVARSATQELILFGGLLAIGTGRTEIGWWAAIAYLVWAGGESGARYTHRERPARRVSRKECERRWAAAEAQLRLASEAIELAESIMAGSPDDEDIQVASQQLRREALRARTTSLEELRTTRSTEEQMREYNRARVKAALEDFEGSRASWPPRMRQNGGPWNGSIADRWNS